MVQKALISNKLPKIEGAILTFSKLSGATAPLEQPLTEALYVIWKNLAQIEKKNLSTCLPNFAL